MTPTEDRPQIAAGVKVGRAGSILRFAIAVLVPGAILGWMVYSNIHARQVSARTLVRTTEQSAAPVVEIVHPTRGASRAEIVLPGTAQAFVDAPIYARTNGYLKRWYFDIGSYVQQGQLLAEIETPEVDQQLRQARADLQTARANHSLATITAERWQTLLKSNSVSRQETDQAVANELAQQAIVQSNAANVRRLEELQSFEKIYAPFDGVITARNTDVGALINAGAATTPGRELFHLAAIQTLRVFVAVPEVYERAAVSGAHATLTLQEFPGQVFRGVLVRNSKAIDPAARTLLVEVDVDNRDSRLLPGAYMLVHLKLPAAVGSVVIPSDTVLFRSEGLRVAVANNGRVSLRPITVGRDYGDKLEVLSGLQATDAIVVNPSDSLLDGDTVKIRKPAR